VKDTACSKAGHYHLVACQGADRRSRLQTGLRIDQLKRRIAQGVISERVAGRPK
jgi:hypothetical protein